MKDEVFITSSFEETQNIGSDFAKSLRLGHVVCLLGDLGSGKTTFVQGLAKGLGIKKRIISPTFVIVRNYRIKNYESRIMNFYHIDLYRVESEKDIKGLGIEEIIKDWQNIVAIEWAEKMGNLLPQNRWDVRLEYLGEDKRKILIVSS